MNKKVYLDENYKLDCMVNINYIGYIRTGELGDAMEMSTISAFDNVYNLDYYRKINDSYVKRSSQ